MRSRSPIVLAGFAVARRGFFGYRRRAIVAFSGLVKRPAALAAVALAVAAAARAPRRGDRHRHSRRAFSIPVARPASALRLAPHGQYAPQASLQAIVAPFSPLAADRAAGALARRARGARLRRAARAATREGWIWLGIAAWALDPEPVSVVRRLAGRARRARAAVARRSRRDPALVHVAAALRSRRGRGARPGGSAALGVAAALPLLALLGRAVGSAGIMSDSHDRVAQSRNRAASAGRPTCVAGRRAASWQNCARTLRALRALPGDKPGAYALHETIAAARPALLAALQRDLGGTLLAVVADARRRRARFADLLYYLGERGDRVALLRSRDEARRRHREPLGAKRAHDAARRSRAGTRRGSCWRRSPPSANR